MYLRRTIIGYFVMVMSVMSCNSMELPQNSEGAHVTHSSLRYVDQAMTSMGSYFTPEVGCAAVGFIAGGYMACKLASKYDQLKNHIKYQAPLIIPTVSAVLYYYYGTSPVIDCLTYSLIGTAAGVTVIGGGGFLLMTYLGSGYHV